jgi:protein-disulfide isomerase
MFSSKVVIGICLLFSVVAAIMAGASLLIDVGLLKPRMVSSMSAEAQIRQYIIDNPQVILEAVQRHDEAQQAAAEDEAKLALVQNKKELHSSQSPVGGNPQGDVTVVEFFDYNCPYCRKAGPVLTDAITADKALRIVYKEWPILGPGSEYAAKAALAAQMQGKYQTFHDALMTSSSKVDETSTLQIATTIGLDVERLKRDMEGETVRTELERNFALAEKLRITGTPAFVIGDEIIRGLVDLPTLQQTIAKAREQSKG